MGTVQHHGDDRYSADHAEYQPDAKIAASGERLNNERCPKGVTVKPNGSEEKDKPKMPDRRVRQRCKDTDRTCYVAGSLLGRKSARQPIFLGRAKPIRHL